MSEKDRDASRRAMVSVRERRRNSGLCLICGNNSVAGTTYVRCESCRLKESERGKKWRAIHTDRCIQCYGAAAPGMRRCVRCQGSQRLRDRARQATLADKFLCVKCSTPCLSPLKLKRPTSRLCETCYLKRRSQQRLGNQKHWKAILDKLGQQGWKCAYTGEAIVLGENDALDHRMPTRRFPLLRHDVTNVEWVTRDINQMKWDRTPDEFLALLRRIIATVNVNPKNDETGQLPGLAIA